jgi:hypothetical protein
MGGVPAHARRGTGGLVMPQGRPWQVYARRVFYFDYLASNTNSAQQNTVDSPVTLQAGQTITVGTCGLPDVSASGDTYLRLIGPSGQAVANNDDACGGLSSNMVYTVPLAAMAPTSSRRVATPLGAAAAGSGTSSGRCLSVILLWWYARTRREHLSGRGRVLRFGAAEVP